MTFPSFITRITSASRMVDNLWATIKLVRPSIILAKAQLSRITEIKSHGYVTRVSGKGKKNEQRTLSEKTRGTACLAPVRKPRCLKRNGPLEQVRDGTALSLQRPGDVSRMRQGWGLSQGLLLAHSVPGCFSSSQTLKSQEENRAKHASGVPI